MDEDRYVYRDSDLERVAPSQLRIGDLIAFLGPVGTDLCSANPVTYVGRAGYSDFWHDETYRVEYRSPWGEGYFVNPDQMLVSRVTSATCARAAARC